MRPRPKWLLLTAFLLAAPHLAAQQETVLTLQRSIDIALGGSYSVQSYREQKQSSEHDYLYYRAQFKPRLDFTLLAPSWDEMVSPIPQANGLPVYNSVGSLNYSGRLQFTYPLPTGGNLSLISALNRMNDKTVLSMEGYETLRDRRAQSSFSLRFDQPIFTRNTLDENLEAARIDGVNLWQELRSVILPCSTCRGSPRFPLCWCCRLRTRISPSSSAAISS